MSFYNDPKKVTSKFNRRRRFSFFIRFASIQQIEDDEAFRNKGDFVESRNSK